MYENLTSYSKSSTRHISANTVLARYKKSEPDQAFYSYSKQTSNMCLMYSICGHWPLRGIVVLFSKY